jgi:hypothetical protein
VTAKFILSLYIPGDTYFALCTLTVIVIAVHVVTMLTAGRSMVLFLARGKTFSSSPKR